MEHFPLGVIIPAYNKPEEFHFLLEGLANQYNFSDFYTIIINDNADNPKEISQVCDSFKDRLHLIYFQNSKNLGPGPSRNIGIDWCVENNIEYIMFLDSDDFIAPGAIKFLLNNIISNQADLVFDNWSNIFSNYQYTLTAAPDCLIYVFYKIYRTSSIGDLRFLNIRIAEDICFNLNFCDKNKNIFYINSKFTNYYHKMYDDSLTTSCVKWKNYKESIFYNHLLAIEKFLENSQSVSFFDNSLVAYFFNIYTLYEEGIICSPKDKKHFDKLVTKILSDFRVQELYNEASCYVDQGGILSYNPFSCNTIHHSHYTTIDEIANIDFFKDSLIKFFNDHGFYPNIDCNKLKNPGYIVGSYII